MADPALRAIQSVVAIEMYRRMVRIREFDTLVPMMVKMGRIRGTAHAAVGQEAVAVGTCFALRPSDRITSTHRGHGHAIAKGVAVEPMMAELFGRETGCCRGTGGSMHIADFSVGMLGANGVVGGGFGIATGAALGLRLQRLGRRGRRASSATAPSTRAPSSRTPTTPRSTACRSSTSARTTATRCRCGRPARPRSSSVADRAAAFGFPGVSVDGMDVVATYEAVQRRGRARPRAATGPTLVVAACYRFEGHHVGDARELPGRRRGRGLARARPDRDVPRDASSAAGIARRARPPTASTPRSAAQSRPRSTPPRRRRSDRLTGPGTTSTRRPDDEPIRDQRRRRGARPSGRSTYAAALNEALREEMERDPTVFCIGEDIAVWGGGGGVYGVTRDLVERVRRRSAIRDTPGVGGGDRRPRRRGRSGRAAPGRRDHVLGLPDPGHGPDRQPGRQDALHVRRPGVGAAGHPHQQRRAGQQGRPALPVARSLVHAHPGAEGGHARARRPTPRDCSSPPSATTTRSSSSSTSGSTSRRARFPSASGRSRSASPRSGGEGRRRHGRRQPAAGRPGARRRRDARRRGHRARGHRRPDDQPARHGDDQRLGPQDRPAHRRARGQPDRRLGRGGRGPRRRGTTSTTSTRRSSASPPRTHRSRSTRCSNAPSSRRRARSWRPLGPSSESDVATPRKGTPMEYRRLGTTDMDVSVIALGCWPFAGGEYWGDQDDQTSIDTVHAALAAGINFFDTAEGYEDGYSERVLGRALVGPAVGGDRGDQGVGLEPAARRRRRRLRSQSREPADGLRRPVPDPLAQPRRAAGRHGRRAATDSRSRARSGRSASAISPSAT